MPKPKYLTDRSLVESGDSLVVSIPSEYLKKHNLTKKDVLLIYESENALLMIPHKKQETTDLAEQSLNEYLKSIGFL